MICVQLEPRHLAMVEEILRRYVPAKRVWAFGSRANGRRLKTFSDLDLALEGRLTAKEYGDLVEAFDESLLPMKVDLVELDRVSLEFKERIARDFVVVQDSGAVVR